MISFKQYLLFEAVRDTKRAEKLLAYLETKKSNKYGDIPTQHDFDKTDYDKVSDAVHYDQKGKNLGHGTREKYWQQRNDQIKTKKLQISKLNVLQSTVNPKTVRAKLNSKDDSPISVYKYDGKHFVIDGHHRLVASKLKGETHINARVLNIPLSVFDKKRKNKL